MRDVVEQFTTRCILQHDTNKFVCLDHVIKTNDIGMPNELGDWGVGVRDIRTRRPVELGYQTPVPQNSRRDGEGEAEGTRWW